MTWGNDDVRKISRHSHNPKTNHHIPFPKHGELEEKIVVRHFIFQHCTETISTSGVTTYEIAGEILKEHQGVITLLL